MNSLRILCLALAASLVTSPASFAVGIGQTDTFEDGTTQGWLVNLLGIGAPPVPPVNISSGGPGGAGDNYLLLTFLGGAGAGSRLTAINATQWAGDYTSSGIIFITMDVRNFGSTDLLLRLLFEDPLGGPPLNVAFSTVPVLLPAGGDWTSILFPITAGSLTAAEGNAGDALANATVMRIFHSVADIFPGEAIAAQLGIDNIQALGATAVPEGSSTIVLLSCGLLGVGFWAMGSRRRAGRLGAKSAS